MTKLEAELDRIEKLANAATEGPWSKTSKRDGGIYDKASWMIAHNVCSGVSGIDDSDIHNAAFIADSRTSNPRMVRMIRAYATAHEAWATFRDTKHRFSWNSKLLLEHRKAADEAESALAELQRKDEWV